MKLYDLPRYSYVKILDEKVKQPIANYPIKEENDIIFFDHIDGMYSFCVDNEGNIIHLAAWTEVEIVDKPKSGDYKINLPK